MDIIIINTKILLSLSNNDENYRVIFQRRPQLKSASAYSLVQGHRTWNIKPSGMWSRVKKKFGRLACNLVRNSGDFPHPLKRRYAALVFLFSIKVSGVNERVYKIMISMRQNFSAQLRAQGKNLKFHTMLHLTLISEYFGSCWWEGLRNIRELRTDATLPAMGVNHGRTSQNFSNSEQGLLSRRFT